MFVLAIDTSSPAVTAGVVDVGDSGVALVAERAPLGARGHGELLSPSIAECLRDVGLAPSDIGAVVAGVGPGPYTGLRVGLVTAAAFAQTIDVPAYPVCSLDAIAARAPRGADLVVLTDARRGEVYWARYDAQGARVDGPGVARPEDVPLPDGPTLAGAAAELHADAWPTLDRLPLRYPDPLGLVDVARAALRSGEPGAPLTPLYLRRPDAVEPGRPKAVTR